MGDSWCKWHLDFRLGNRAGFRLCPIFMKGFERHWFTVKDILIIVSLMVGAMSMIAIWVTGLVSICKWLNG